MFVDCPVISIGVIVKHVQHIGIIRAFFSVWGDLFSFSVPGLIKKLLDSGLLEGSVPRLVLCLSIFFGGIRAIFKI